MDYKKGNIVDGVVTGITSYGIFVKIDEQYSGLVHISEISSKFVNSPSDFAKINDPIKVVILDIDNQSEKMKLSIKDVYNHQKYKKNHFVKIVETKHGFETLKKQLPIWIHKSLKSKKIMNCVDKHEY